MRTATVIFENEEQDKKVVVIINSTKNKDKTESLDIKMNFIPDQDLNQKGFHIALLNAFIKGLQDDK